MIPAILLLTSSIKAESQCDETLRAQMKHGRETELQLEAKNELREKHFWESLSLVSIIGIQSLNTHACSRGRRATFCPSQMWLNVARHGWSGNWGANPPSMSWCNAAGGKAPWVRRHERQQESIRAENSPSSKGAESRAWQERRTKQLKEKL